MAKTTVPATDEWDEAFPEKSQEQIDIDAALEAPPAEGWRPEPGDKIVGVLTAVSTTDVGGYGEYPLLTVKKSNGVEVNLFCFHTVLKGWVESHQPKVGQRIGVKYFGRTDHGGATGEGYENYKCIIAD